MLPGTAQGEEPEFYIWPKHHPNVEYDATELRLYLPRRQYHMHGLPFSCVSWRTRPDSTIYLNDKFDEH
jgi:hypothetical protein